MASDPYADGSYTLPGREEDAVTYLPIDRGKPAAAFGPTDLRRSNATGGIRLGQSFRHVSDEAMPRLTADQIGRACDNVVRGHEAYASLLYLSRAQLADIPALLEASQSYEIKVRWERLWVLSVYLARLSRSKDAHKILVDAFADDIAGLHLISKFVEQNNPAVKRMFTRMHDLLVSMLLKKLVEAREDMRKSALLCGILASIETDEAVIRKSFAKNTSSDVIEQLVAHLYTVAPKKKEHRLSSAVLRDRLRSWKQQ